MMKKTTLMIGITVLAFSIKVNAQVGINITQPNSTLDITAKNATGASTNVDGLLIPRVDRQRAQSMASVPASTLIYINNVTTGSQTGTAVNVDATGYYYYNGTAWTKLNPTAPAITNIYNADGTLTENRTVTQGSNTLTFKANSVNAFSVNNSISVDAANNRLGIGTNQPQGLTHVVADNAGSNAGNDFYFDGYGNSKGAAIFVGAANGTFSNPTNLTTGDFIGGYYFKSRINNIWSYSSAGISSSYKGNGTNNLTNLNFITSDNERMLITEDGKVGIGTSTPQIKLDVATEKNSFGIQHTDRNISLRTFVGIGDSNGKTDAAWFGTYSTHPLDFMTANYFRMRIDTNGKVGIGTSTPSGKLTVSGQSGSILSLINTNVSGNPTLNIYPGYTSSGNGITEGNQYAVVFDQDPGSSGSGETQSLYDFHGQIRSVTSSTLSDVRLKEGIENLNEYGLSEVLKIQPRKYILKQYGTPDIGVIAQELKAVVPELVLGDESNGLLSVDYSKISLILVNAIKEQQKQIKEQQEEIKDLQNEIKLLKDYVYGKEKK